MRQFFVNSSEIIILSCSETEVTICSGIDWCFFSGLFSGLLNIGFNRVYSVAEAAVSQGASPANASLVQWIYVFIGGFIVQIIYAVVLLIKNKSYKTYFVSGSGKAFYNIPYCIVLVRSIGALWTGSYNYGKIRKCIRMDNVYIYIPNCK